VSGFRRERIEPRARKGEAAVRFDLISFDFTPYCSWANRLLVRLKFALSSPSRSPRGRFAKLSSSESNNDPSDDGLYCGDAGEYVGDAGLYCGDTGEDVGDSGTPPQAKGSGSANAGA
jgi:hypothetical protein